MPDFSREVHCLLGLPVDAVDLAQAEQRIRMAVASRTQCFLSTPNLNFLIACRTDPTFRHTVLQSDLSVVDGMPLVWLARLQGIPIRERVAGSDLFDRLRKKTSLPMRVYFFGGQDGVAEIACNQLSEVGLSMICSGFDSPGFGSVESMSDDATIARINVSRADFLVVALGAKKGQEWIERNRSRLNVSVISHLGAVVNFVAGTAKRAPKCIQCMGLEWLWRIKEEPQLWRRYLNDGFAFVRLLFTRVLPSLCYRLGQLASTKRQGAAQVTIEEDEQSIKIHLSGALVKNNLGSLRQVFHDAASTRKSLILNMADVVHVDSAFIGIVLLLHGDQRQQGKQLEMVLLPKAVQRMFKYSCAEYLYTQSN